MDALVRRWLMRDGKDEMSKGWSESDRKVLKTVLGRAQKRAEEEALKLFQDEKVERIRDLWDMEMKIREWRRERHGVFYFSYERIEAQIADYLRRGWVLPEDLRSLSEERRDRIMKIESDAGNA